MKRLNRKKLIDQFEGLRQGFRDARDLIAVTPAEKMSMDAYHAAADRAVVALGGKSVRNIHNNALNIDRGNDTPGELA